MNKQRGKTYHRWGVQNRFWGAPLSFPPPSFFSDQIFDFITARCLNQGVSTKKSSLHPTCMNPQIVDVFAEDHGHPHQKVYFPDELAMGRTLLNPGHPGGRVRNVCWKFRPKVYVYVACLPSVYVPFPFLGQEQFDV